MKKTCLLAALCVLLAGIAFAQDKNLELERLMDRALAPQRLQNLQFIPGGNAFAYVFDNTLKTATGNDSSKDLLTLDALNELLKSAGERTLPAFPPVEFTSNNLFTFQAMANVYSVDLQAKQLKTILKIDKAAENVDIEKLTKRVAYTKGNNLYVLSGEHVQAVSDESNEDIVYGQAAHRSEFGITKGTFWSPAGNLLAFYRVDQTMVTDYPLVNINTRIAEATPIKYPMAGMTSHQATVGIYNPESGKIVYLNTRKDTSLAEKESYLTNITWSPDEKYIYIAKLNRGQNHMQLNCYDVATGNFVKTLFEEHHAKYVEPLFGLYFLPGKNNEFLYLSQRDGFMHIYHYTTDGKLIKQVTAGEWVVKNMAGFNEKGTAVFFYATKESPLETHLYSVEIKTGKIERITRQKGTHTVVMNDKGDLFLDTYTSRSVPVEHLLLDRKGNTISTIHTAANPLKDYRMPEMEILTVKSADGQTDLYGRLIKPANFDATKKYPVVVYVYGGPHSQLINESWMGGANLYFLFLAQQGYVVWTLDSRGSANRGFAFESAIHRRLGEAECADQMKGVDYLKTLPFVDANRIAVDGWSYGGFMSISLKLRYPGVFKVATAGGPVVDWKWYEIMYGERYAGNPNDNKEGYASSSVLGYVKNLQGKLLVIHGAQDPTVVWQNSLCFLDACIKQKKQVDYFVYPNHEHNVRGMDRIHLYEKLYNYYQDNL